MSRKMDMLLAQLEVTYDKALTALMVAREYIVVDRPPANPTEARAAFEILASICGEYMVVSHVLIVNTLRGFRDHPISVSEKYIVRLWTKATDTAETFMNSREEAAEIITTLSNVYFESHSKEAPSNSVTKSPKKAHTWIHVSILAMILVSIAGLGVANQSKAGGIDSLNDLAISQKLTECLAWDQEVYDSKGTAYSRLEPIMEEHKCNEILNEALARKLWDGHTSYN